MIRDYLADLGLTQGKKSEGVENIVLPYTIDTTSSAVQKGNIVTFAENKVRKMQNGDSPKAIALEDGNVGDTIKCQLMGVVRIPSFFNVAANYFNTEVGELSTVSVTPSGNIKHIGIAISSDELLLKRGAFIYV